VSSVRAFVLGSMSWGQSTGREWGRSPSGRRSPPNAQAFFVNECLNFDVLEEKFVKR